MDREETELEVAPARRSKIFHSFTPFCITHRQMTAPHDGIDRAPTWRRVFRSGVLFSILGLFQLSAYSPVVARQALINGTLDTYEGYLALGVDHADAIVSDETFEDLEALTNLAVLKLSGIDVT
ncbi:MAG TPA: hypothetical protein VK548_27865, partial [Candidatus Acidoferrum sp.]|nr:hypothetical protein [Candidatus Acidoferrum sp.]